MTWHDLLLPLTCKDHRLVSLLILSSRKHFSCCTRRAMCFGCSSRSSSLCSLGFRFALAGRDQHVALLLLQSLHSPSQLLNSLCLGAELLVQPFYPDAKCCHRFTMMTAWTGRALYKENVIYLLFHNHISSNMSWQVNMTGHLHKHWWATDSTSECLDTIKLTCLAL